MSGAQGAAPDVYQVLSLVDVPSPSLDRDQAASQLLKRKMYRAGNETPEALLQMLSLVLEMHLKPATEQIRHAMQAVVNETVQPDMASNFIVVLEQLLARHPRLFDFLLPAAEENDNDHDDAGSSPALTFLDVLGNLLHCEVLEQTPEQLFVRQRVVQRGAGLGNAATTLLVFKTERERRRSLRRTMLCTLLLTWLRVRKLLKPKARPVLQGREAGECAKRCIETSLDILKGAREQVRDGDCSQDVYWDLVFFCVTLAKELDVAVQRSGAEWTVQQFWMVLEQTDRALHADHKFAYNAYEVMLP